MAKLFSLSKLNYYISNIKLKTNDGKEFIVPQDSSYFLVMENEEESQEVTIKHIPAGDYNQITFTIGVDSLRSTMDITKRQGVLDPPKATMACTGRGIQVTFFLRWKGLHRQLPVGSGS